MKPRTTSGSLDKSMDSTVSDEEREYQYQALPDSSSIRILVLEAGERDEPLKGTLEVVDIHSQTSYEPLSYVWGPANFVRDISIFNSRAGQLLKLTPSLHGALKRFRHPNRNRRLWADQICINQQDSEERSQQMQHMNRIYERANRVLVWLGVDRQQLAQPAFSFIHELNRIFENGQDVNKFRVANIEDLEPQSIDKWKVLKHLTHLAWVSRLLHRKKSGPLLVLS